MTTTAETERPTQALEAIAEANRIRIAQKDMLYLLSRSELALDQVFDIEEAQNMTIFRVLEALPHQLTLPSDHRPRRNTSTAEQILARADISGDRRVKSFHCDVTTHTVLTAAYDYVGKSAWIYLEDNPPILRPRKSHPKASPAFKAKSTEALAKANRIRGRRKDMKAAPRSGEMSVEDVLRDPASETWEIGRLVERLPLIDRETGMPRSRTASAKAQPALKRAGIALTHPVGRFEPFEIDAIVGLLNATMLSAPDCHRTAK